MSTGPTLACETSRTSKNSFTKVTTSFGVSQPRITKLKVFDITYTNTSISSRLDVTPQTSGQWQIRYFTILNILTYHK